MDAIKLEGGAPSRISAAGAIVEAGIAVMGHVGLTPQAISVLGGFRPQGRNVSSAVKVRACLHSDRIFLLLIWVYYGEGLHSVRLKRRNKAKIYFILLVPTKLSQFMEQ